MHMWIIAANSTVVIWYIVLFRQKTTDRPDEQGPFSSAFMSLCDMALSGKFLADFFP